MYNISRIGEVTPGESAKAFELYAGQADIIKQQNGMPGWGIALSTVLIFAIFVLPGLAAATPKK